MFFLTIILFAKSVYDNGKYYLFIDSIRAPPLLGWGMGRKPLLFTEAKY
jgi:hypothetical protein